MTSQEPVVSWLRLERYHLGELSPSEAADVERALAASPETRACLDEIQKPVVLRPLPARVRPKSVLRTRWPLLSLAAALACGALFFVRPQTEVGPPAPSVRVKGGDVALRLVRERRGVVDMAPTTFAEGDRLKVLVTCPPAFDGTFDVFVLQRGVAEFPFAATSVVACGNDVPVPGAFTLTGPAPASVCVTWSRETDTRREVERRGIDAVRDVAVCTPLEPE